MSPTYDPTPREDKREDDRLAGIERRAFDAGAKAMQRCAVEMLLGCTNSYERNTMELRIWALDIKNLEGRP